MKIFLAIMVAALFLPVGARAQDSPCDEVKDGLWICPIPDPPSARTCKKVGKYLVCNGPVFGDVPAGVVQPSNCRWAINRRGEREYTCW